MPAFFSIALLFTGLPVFAAPCESLSNLKLEATTITSAAVVPAGAFALPGGSAEAFKSLPAFCRVTVQIKPSKDSDIKIEVWMPVSGWNGRYQGQGNGGFAGSIFYPGLAGAVGHGYAAASTDTGHTGQATDGTWALGHQEKIVDFGYRAIHEMTVKAKAIIQAFYGDPVKHSYFSSCSNGGRQGLMEAQRYPEDYDGIIAGAPANFMTHLLIAGVWDLQTLEGNPASYIPAEKLPAIGAAVLAACDAQDGVKDGLLNDPRQCQFEPGNMLCQDLETKSCLTPPQVLALTKLYTGARNSRREQIFPGYSPGAEGEPFTWNLWITGRGPGTSLKYAFTTNFFANMIFDAPGWSFKTFNFEKDVKVTDDKQAATLNATDPNLKAFKARGGKLIIYHGWSDPGIAPLSTIDYYNSVVSTMGASQTSEFLRLFMAPGMQHCFGGPGPNSFGQGPLTGTNTDPGHNIFYALEQWVEKGTGPDRVIATKYNNDMNPAQGVKMTRPLCTYPKVAKYKGSGDTNDAANFSCEAEKK